MNAADTNASSAMADWTLLTDVPRSSATAVIDTFMMEVSTTNTNIAIASSRARRGLPASTEGASSAVGLRSSDIHYPPLVVFPGRSSRSWIIPVAGSAVHRGPEGLAGLDESDWVERALPLHEVGLGHDTQVVELATHSSGMPSPGPSRNSWGCSG
jgi:hypothetical protein